MATKAQIKFTYEDYKSLPYVERQRYELLRRRVDPDDAIARRGSSSCLDCSSISVI
jgi:hypothetical protein